MRFILAATIGVVLGVLLLGGCWDATPAGGAAPSDLSTYLDDLARKGQLTGSVLVARRGTTLVDRGFGLADVATDAPNRPDTQFRIGSNTKQFAALAIRLLAHQGKLAVGDPICAHLDPCPPAWAPITVQQLIDHSSGLPDYTNFPDFPQLIGTPATVEQLIARFQDLPLEFVPGTRWRYSNSGYVVLSEIIARASGQSFSDFCQARIWGPLHMARTLYDLNNPPKPSHATGYLSPGVEPVYIDMSEVDAAGAVASTVEDLALWDAALLDESLLPASDMAELFRPKIACPSGGCALPTDLGYADGWFVAQENGARYVYPLGPDRRIPLVERLLPRAGHRGDRPQQPGDGGCLGARQPAGSDGALPVVPRLASAQPPFFDGNFSRSARNTFAGTSSETSPPSDATSRTSCDEM